MPTTEATQWWSVPLRTVTHSIQPGQTITSVLLCWSLPPRWAVERGLFFFFVALLPVLGNWTVGRGQHHFLCHFSFLHAFTKSE